MTESTPISTAILAKALILALEEHDDLRVRFRLQANKAFKALKNITDPTRKDHETIKTDLTKVLTRINDANTLYTRLEAICLGTSPEVSMDEKWTTIPSDLRDLLSGHLEEVAMAEAQKLHAQANANPQASVNVRAAGVTDIALCLLTGSFEQTA